MGAENGEFRCSPMKVPVAVSEVSSRFQFMRMPLYGSRRPVVQAIAWVLRLVLLLGMLTPSVSLASDGEIVSVRHAMLPGGRLQLDIGLAGEVGEPSVFRTNKPDRIVLDFFDVSSAVESRVHEVDRGSVDSVIVAATESRTRVIVNLIASVSFESLRQDNELVLLIDPALADNAVVDDETDLVPDQTTDVSLSPFQITAVDFRRGTEGSGVMMIHLNAEEVGVSVDEKHGEITLDLMHTELADGLERRLDVIDFATPVQFIDAFRMDDRTRIVIVAHGKYNYVTFQTGSRFTVEVAPQSALESAEESAINYAGEPLSFDFQNITVRNALQIIAEETGINFVISDTVTGEMTLRLKDVPWDQALDTIMQTKGLAKRERNNVIWIAPAEEIAEKERIALESSQNLLVLEPLISELVQINYAKAEDIADLLKSVKAVEPQIDSSMFGSVSVGDIATEENQLLSERGSVTVDKRTNALLIQDTRQKITEIRKLISEIDKPVKQVLIETRIVIADESFSRNIGAKLGLTGINERIGTLIGSGSVANTNSIRSEGITDAEGESLSVNLPATGIGTEQATSYALTLAKAGAGWGAIIDLEISALEAEGSGKIIANPKLLTADKQEAKIEQGQERIFTTNTLGEGTVVTKKAVLGLTVTPQITPDDRLILDVEVTKDSFVSATEENINTLKVETQVLLENGETVIIGGIYSQEETKSVSKVPYLGDIPGLGVLFRVKSVLDERSELLIFLTPRIVNPILTAG